MGEDRSPVPRIESEPAPADVAFLEDSINDFNFERTGTWDAALLAAFVRDPEERIVAGIYGWTWGGCCDIRYLWVDPAHRGRGHGRSLLAAAEEEARHRGCRHVVLETHSFQAPGFYARLGYEAVGSYPDYPAGHEKIFMRKRLA
jgi:ribosomal protein S18 acetylase RimI-like enzyme